MNQLEDNTDTINYEELNGEIAVYTEEEWVNQYGLHPMSFANFDGDK